jgi:hypothetical protein
MKPAYRQSLQNDTWKKVNINNPQLIPSQTKPQTSISRKY